MSITAAMVKELRERTGAGMMECKKALQAVDGDIEKAIEEMRKSGSIKAAKKAGRVASEGVIAMRTSDDGQQAVIVEINSETDFVARDENFLAFVEKVATRALAVNDDSVETLSNTALEEGGQTTEEVRAELVAKVGENVNVRRFQHLTTTGTLAHYIHGSRIGVLVALKGGDNELAKDIAMHIAACNPDYISQDDVSESRIAEEKAIFSAQATESGKPQEIIEKMIGGRIKKFLDEISLLGQPYVKDPSQNVASVLRSANVTVESFIRFEVGEGIEKKTENFAEEVMAQVRGE